MSNDDKLVWAEKLPDGCPPVDANIPDDNTCYYRLVDTVPPTLNDFHSIRMLFPEREVDDECKARAVSLLSSEHACRLQQKFPLLRNKIPLKIVLPSESGLIKKTGNEHWSWWRAKDFDIVSYCQQNI